MAIRGFMGAVNRPQPALWITLARDPGQCAAGLSFDLWRMGIAAAGTVRRRACHHDDQFRHCSGRPLVCDTRAAPFRKYHVLGRIWRIDWRLMRQLVAHRRADLAVVHAGIRLVLHRGSADGPDQHHRAGGASDRAAGHRDPVHGAVRHQHGGDRAGRARHRPQRSERRSSARAWLRSLLGIALVAGFTLAVIARPVRHRAVFLRRRRRTPRSPSS